VTREEEVVMPGHDGTGPRGQGPMTGKGLGFRIMRIPSAPGEPFMGFAGKSGRPVFSSTVNLDTDIESAGRGRRTRAVLKKVGGTERRHKGFRFGSREDSRWP